MNRLLRRTLPAWAVAICLLGSVCLPAPALAENMGRTLGGAAGLAAGSMGGAALASSVISAGGLAALGPLGPLLVGTAIVAASAWGGSKAMSYLGYELDQAMGPKAVWTMLGATLGAVAALALIPAAGPFVGPLGLVVKGLVGGVAGGALAGLFSKQLEAVATPRTLYAAAGGAIGAVAGGIPGAIAGVAGGYTVGAVMDENFFAKEDEYWNEGHRRDTRGRSQVRDRFTDARDDIQDWVYDRTDRFAERQQTKPWRYADCDESFYWQNDYSDEDYRAQQRPGHRKGDEGRNESGNLFELRTQWQEAVVALKEVQQDPDATRASVGRALDRVKKAEQVYERALRAAQGY